MLSCMSMQKVHAFVVICPIQKRSHYSTHQGFAQAAWLTACMMGPGKAVFGARISATRMHTRSMSSSLIILPGDLPGPPASVLGLSLTEGPFYIVTGAVGQPSI